MQAQRITGSIDITRMLEVALSAVLIAALVVGLIVATLGLGFEGSAARGPMPASVALEAR